MTALGQTTLLESRGLLVGTGSVSSFPINLTVPQVTGLAQVGQTLSSSTGTWANGPTSFTYQWKADGIDIAGATGSTFLLTLTQANKTITVGVVGINGAGSSLPAISVGVGPVSSSTSAGEPFGLLLSITKAN